MIGAEELDGAVARPRPRVGVNDRKEEFLALYHSGATDRAIEEHMGYSHGVARSARIRFGLPPHVRRWGHSAKKVITGDVEQKCIELNRNGVRDEAIGRQFGVSGRTVADWRKKLGIPAVPRVRPAPRRPRRGLEKSPGYNPIFRDALFVRCSRAVGTRLAADVAVEAVSDMILAVLSGELDESQIEAEANSYRNRAFGRWCSPYAPRSLDHALYEDSDVTLFSTLACEDQASQLRMVELFIDAGRLGIDVAQYL